MELIEAIETRASSGRLTGPGPTPEHLALILKAASQAPDHGRLKPWRIIALADAARETFNEAVVAARRGRQPAPSEEQIEAERAKISRSPTLVIVGCVVTPNHPKVPEVEQLLASGAAAQNLFLAAHALGYGVMWKTGPAAYDAGVKASVGLTPADHIVGIMHLGTRVT
jgi:nitroreductase